VGVKQSGQDNWAHQVRCNYQARCKLNDISVQVELNDISVRGKGLVMEYNR